MDEFKDENFANEIEQCQKGIEEIKEHNRKRAEILRANASEKVYFARNYKLVRADTKRLLYSVHEELFNGTETDANQKGNSETQMETLKPNIVDISIKNSGNGITTDKFEYNIPKIQPVGIMVDKEIEKKIPYANLPHQLKRAFAAELGGRQKQYWRAKSYGGLAFFVSRGEERDFVDVCG